MTPQVWVAVVSGLLGLASAGVAAALAARAQRASAEVGDKAAVLEGYDELVSHLQTRITYLEQREKEREQRIGRLEREVADCNRKLALRDG